MIKFEYSITFINIYYNEFFIILYLILYIKHFFFLIMKFNYHLSILKLMIFNTLKISFFLLMFIDENKKII